MSESIKYTVSVLGDFYEKKEFELLIRKLSFADIISD